MFAVEMFALEEGGGEGGSAGGEGAGRRAERGEEVTRDGIGEVFNDKRD